MKELAIALSKAQAEFTNPELDCQNKHLNYWYASLGATIAAIRPALNKHGLFLTQTVSDKNIITKIIHTSGETLEGITPLFIDKLTMQGLGSAMTYARRYGISALLGIVADSDDDGLAANRNSDNDNNSNQKKVVFTSMGASPTSKPKQTLGIHPEQPTKGDGMPPQDGTYRINFGKWKGTKVSDHHKDELISYVEYIESSSARDNKDVSPNGKTFIAEVTKYLASLENAPFNDDANGDDKL
jgi:hypothetical protein